MKYKKNENQFTLVNLVFTGLFTLLLAACGGAGDGSGCDNTDPSVQDFPVAYVQRPAPVDGNGDVTSRDYTEVDSFDPGAVLYVKRQATTCSPPIDVTSRAIGNTGDVKDVEISRDGTRLVFAMKEADDNADTDLETWNIWEYEIATDTLTRYIPLSQNLIAEDGDDRMPHYLADGRIIFSSSRQGRSISVQRKEENSNFVSKSPGRRAVADNSQDLTFNLHVMEKDSDDIVSIRQVSFNQGHDLEPSLMDDGRVLFTRWDNEGANRGFNLYTMNPDGSNTQLLYGRRSHDTGRDNDVIHFTQPREMQDGHILTITRPFDNTFDGGDIVAIDVPRFLDNNRPIQPGTGGVAQTSLSGNSVRTAPGLSTGGRYSSAYPFWDGTGRMLVSWSACGLELNGELVRCTDENLVNPAAVPAAPRYGLFVFDPAGRNMRPVVLPVAPSFDAQTGRFSYTYITDAVVAQDRARLGNTIDVVDETASSQTGIINIRSVYDFGSAAGWGFFQGTDSTAAMQAIRDPAVAPLYADHPARFVRIVKGVSLPPTDILDLDPDAFGSNNGNSNVGRGMREIVGYAPVQPDGSARFRVPADVPLALDIVDEKGRRLNGSQPHNTWITVRNGQIIRCIGCHTTTANSTLNNPHGRSDAEPLSNNPGAPVAATAFSNTLNTFNSGILYRSTMAEARYPDDSAPELDPGLDIVFTDVWTDPAATTPLPDINLLYTAVYDVPALANAMPVSNGCLTSWNDGCRAIFNYAEHIAPLWHKDRGAGVTCVECHTDGDAAGLRRPAGQLDLDDDLNIPGLDSNITNSPDSNPNDNFLESYAELFIQDQAIDVVGGAIVPRQASSGGLLLYIDNLTLQQTTSAVDANGDPNQPVIEMKQPSMSVNGARASYFMQKMSGDDLGLPARSNPPDATLDHTGFMSDSELKVIAEWLDLGGQYYNNPFATGVPTE